MWGPGRDSVPEPLSSDTAGSPGDGIIVKVEIEFSDRGGFSSIIRDARIRES
jgi:hypothetical protein